MMNTAGRASCSAGKWTTRCGGARWVRPWPGRPGWRGGFRPRASRSRAWWTGASPTLTASWTPIHSLVTEHTQKAVCRGSRPPRSSTSRRAEDRRFRRSWWRRDEATVAHARHRGGVPDHRSHDARAEIVHHGAPRRRSSGPGPGEARAASVDRGGRHHGVRSEEHTSELQSRLHLVCRLLLEKKKKMKRMIRQLREQTS